MPFQLTLSTIFKTNRFLFVTDEKKLRGIELRQLSEPINWNKRELQKKEEKPLKLY